MPVAEVSIVPIGVGPSISKYVKRAIEVFKKYDLKVETCAMGTILEGELDEIIRAYKEAHEVVLNDTIRVLSTLKIDDRTDKEHTIERKLNAIK
ncbi:MTH1187 family thiamine-binding protein [Methanothermococcus sp. SCGC AD-155-M21]|nr:MTH1187 family thiamine-binding protein [Methanothermococcus sp. SCGC AD-155-M21]